MKKSVQNYWDEKLVEFERDGVDLELGPHDMQPLDSPCGHESKVIIDGLVAMAKPLGGLRGVVVDEAVESIQVIWMG